MVSVNPIHVSEWLAIFRPVKDQLRAALKKIVRDENRDETDRDARDELSGRLRRRIARASWWICSRKPASRNSALVFPEIDRRQEQSLPLLEREIREDDEPPSRSEDEKDRRAERQAKAAVALFRLGAVEPVWPLLAHRSDPRVRSFLIHWLARLGDDPRTLQACLEQMRASHRRSRCAGSEPARSAGRPEPINPVRP